VDIRTSDEGLIEAYVFERHVEPGGIAAIKGSLATAPGVRFVAQFVGAFNLFARVVAEDLGQLQSRIAGEYFDSGVRSDWSLNLTGPKPTAPKRGSPVICALVCCRTSVTDVFGLSDSLDTTFSKLPAGQSFASAVVNAPDFDILVDLGAETLEDVLDLVVKLRGELPDGARTATAFADLSNNAIRPAP
jgi:hypothetical protein